jgi:excisionase family DNA binding protein
MDRKQTVNTDSPPVPAANEIPRIVLTREEAARALGVCLKTLDNLIRNQQLPVCRIRGRVMLSVRQLQEFAYRGGTLKPRGWNRRGQAAS